MILNITKGLTKLLSARVTKNIWESIKFRINEKNDIWDMRENLLGFINGTYDLQKGIFREGRPEDYITKVVTYEFRDCTADEIEFAENHFKQVLPDAGVRDLFFTTLASGLRGRVLQKFIIWTGIGANSKSSTSKIVRTVFGDKLYCKGNNSVLTQEIKGEISVNISAMDNKRIVFYEEPSANRKIITNVMKELTGGDSMAFRKLFSNQIGVNIKATQIMMCNKKPLLDEVTEAVHRRLIIIPFESQFRTKEHIEKFIPKGTPNVFEARDEVDGAEFLNKIKIPFLHILLRYYKTFMNDKFEIRNIPEKCRRLVQEYMVQSDEFSTWFSGAYEFTNNDNDYVKVADIYENYKSSYLYENLDKKTRRTKGTKKAVIADIKENPTLKMYFREEYYKNSIRVRTCMIRYREKIEQVDE